MSPKQEPEKPVTEEPEAAAAPEQPPQESVLGKKAGKNAAEDTIQQLEAEVAALRDQRMRALAETDNVRKRAQRDLEETARYAISAFAKDMVSVLENLKRASESVHTHKGNDEIVKTVSEGIDLTLKELLSIFEKYGIKRIDPMGQKFDHNLHQAVVQVDRDDVPPGTVVEVVQAGYVIHDRLLRPAMVAVSKPPPDAPKKVDTTA